MLINILYVCTGDYKNYFDKFHQSCENHLFPGDEKKYYIFSDGEERYFSKYSNVKIVHVENNSWPLNTLLRFSYFYKVIDELKMESYTFFFNANALIVKDITVDMLGDANLFGVEHPGYKDKWSIFFPWERRRMSSCYMSYLNKGTYFQGCLNGGKTKAFIELIKTCNTMTINDLKKNIIARVHDESYLNHYFYNNRPLVFSVLFAWPEKYGENPDAIIVMRDKEKENWYLHVKQQHH